MKIYLAGNFPQMAIVEKEHKVLQIMVKRGRYNRLVSFYFSSTASIWDLIDNVILAVKIAKQPIRRKK
jgi:hypothetical protein